MASKKDFNWQVLDAILELNAKQRFCAEKLNVSEDTIERRIREEYNMTFAEYRDKRRDNVRIKLVETALDKALTGNITMLIFCLKNYCGWSDNPKEFNESNIKILYEVIDKYKEEKKVS